MHQHGKAYKVNLAPVFLLNLAFTLIEIGGGIYTNSAAVFSDALHDFGDTLSIGLAWYFQQLSQRSASSSFTFGYKRFNTLGAFFTGIVLLVGAVVIAFEAIPRLFNPEPVNSAGMMVMAVIGIGANGWAYALLHRKQGGLNAEMIRLHLLEDVLGWLAILVGGFFVYTMDWVWLDPLLSLGIMLFVSIQAIKHLRTAIKILMQARPEGWSVGEIEASILSLEHINHVHHTHLWSLDGDYHILTTHVRVNCSHTLSDAMKIKGEVHKKLRAIGIQHATVELEVGRE